MSITIIVIYYIGSFHFDCGAFGQYSNTTCPTMNLGVKVGVDKKITSLLPFYALTALNGVKNNYLDS